MSAAMRACDESPRAVALSASSSNRSTAASTAAVLFSPVRDDSRSIFSTTMGLAI